MSEYQRLRAAFLEGIRQLDPKGCIHDADIKVALDRYPDSPMPSNVREIVADYLKREGFDGLFDPEGTCFCFVISDGTEREAPCDLCGTCRPGVLVDGKIKESEG